MGLPPGGSQPKRLLVTTVRGEGSAPLLTATGELHLTAKPESVHCAMREARLECQFPIAWRGAATLLVEAPGYQVASVPIADVWVAEQGEVRLQSTNVTLPRLVSTGGAQFQLETGEPFVIKGITHFQLYQKFLAGEDLTLYLDDLMRPGVVDANGVRGPPTCGPNLLRVFGMAVNLFHLDPREHADYYEKIPPFTQKLASHQCRYYVEFVAFADSLLMGEWANTTPQLAHWDRLQPVFAQALTESGNLLVELVNENDAGNPAQGQVNWIDTDRFPMPAAPLCAAHGSNGGGGIPVRPPWCYETGPHTNDSYEWPRKVGHNAGELSWDSRVPAYANENTRAADRFYNAIWAFDAARGCALLSAGCTFHCAGCRFSQLLTPLEKDMLWAWLDGIESLPLSCQVRGQAQYRHPIEWEETDGAITGERVYTNANDPVTCKTRIRPPLPH